ncbi:hypothetical protein B0T24DRAFT_671693 [Lasiosphaeria ovina]|uniref:[histone H3]-trimethyl-L-lysine(9) demethylase n=1 Tax=Lasiosphaeria ovina TaxID=92902 RepID=A0AAE0JTA5_9PEZI|nr:hypothetical protein B0T24DRAFT_671693 [Lasiosphaeria ovina]
MSTEAIGAAAPESTIVLNVEPPSAATISSKPVALHSPPDSNDAMNLDGSDSELSDIDEVADKLNGTHKFDFEPAPEAASAPEPEPEAQAELEPTVPAEEDIGEILPDHFSGTVPVFRPTMKQFEDFKRFMEKVDHYGMKSGIVKIIPPQEWKDSLPELHDLVKQVRVREPIKQDIMGSNGTYRQVNFLHQRSYNLPQWRQLCDQSEHQPPARRGERRANAEKHKPVTRSRAPAASSAKQGPTPKKRKGRQTRGSARAAKEEVVDPEERPITPVSPAPEKQEVVESVEQDPGVKDECEDDEDDEPVVRRMGFARQSKPKTQSTSARRKYSRREGSARIDESAFENWDYRMDVSDYTPERCEELERIYWKTLTYASPLYGADLPGTMFDESTKIWNLNKLPNLLDVLGTKVPGVNTAYLYLGMWKATFAWHLEDVDLYSINYLHFGAPKQWYSISQADARRFEAAMKNIWPTDAKACDQFLRHKAFLISPAHLKQHFNITVNKCVSYPGEFVVTYPYGYHSGYNLGYNCAEAVNFALDSWLPMGKIAKKCQCAQAQDSVWVDVYEIERKLRGESTEYEETEDEEEEDEDQETGLPSPPSSHGVRVKGPGRKRKRLAGEQEPKGKTKKIRLRLKAPVETPCCLCPNDIAGAEIMPTDDGRKAHRMCALYLPETYIETVDDKEIIVNVAGIDKARLELKCLYCRSKKGACFQCSQKKCPRSYHATCAAAAGVFVEDGEVPIIGEDGTEYKEQAFEFSCRFHRTKRDRKNDGDSLEENPQIREAAAALKKNDICQTQYFRGEIFAGMVVENRHDEETFLLDIIPNGDRVEVEWKWLLLPDPSDFRLPKASAKAIPMPTSRKAKQEINGKRQVDELPRKDDEFVAGFTWFEFNTGDPPKNLAQVKIDFSKENQVWHYLGKTSTEAKAQYTDNPSVPQHNLKSNFLDSIPKPPPVVGPSQPRRSYPAAHPVKALLPGTAPGTDPKTLPGAAVQRPKPYVYKPRKKMEAVFVQFPSQPPLQPQLQPQPQRQHVFQPSPVPLPAHFQRIAQQPRLQLQPLPQQQQQPQQQRFPQQQPLAPQQQQQQQQHPPLQVMQYQPPGKDQWQKGSSSYYSSHRFAPVGGSNGFPQLPGLTWPPAHMKSGQNSQLRVWPSSTDAAALRPYPRSMTPPALQSPSFALPQSDIAGVQPQIGTYQKYSFFQVHHNRDSSRYRTPYGHWGGFTNGYEGNLRAFLIRAQHALSGKKTALKAIPASLLQPLQPRIAPSPSGQPSTPSHGTPQNRAFSHPESQSPRKSFYYDNSRVLPTAVASQSYQDQVHHSIPTHTETPEVQQPVSTPLHPAIRPQYGSPWSDMSQNNSNTWSSPTPNKPSPPPARPSAQAKAPTYHKQSHSPIPLPSYVKQVPVLAAANNPIPSPLSRPPLLAASPQTGSWNESGASEISSPAPITFEHTYPPPPQNHQQQQQQQQQQPQLHHHLQPHLQPYQQPQHQQQQPQQPQQQQSYWAPSHDFVDQSFYPAPPTAGISSGTPQYSSPYHHPSFDMTAGFDGGGYHDQTYFSPMLAETQAPEEEVSADPAALVEKMMLNLRRASQMGAPT